MANPSLSSWKKAGTYSIELPSGFVATVRLPDLGMMLANGSFPNELREVALKADAESESASVSPEQMQSVLDFNRQVIAATVVGPALKPEDVDDLPAEDRDCLLAIANRQLDPKTLAPKAA